jgi:hypothetical protein
MFTRVQFRRKIPIVDLVRRIGGIQPPNYFVHGRNTEMFHQCGAVI